jgi:hypothetical protein
LLPSTAHDRVKGASSLRSSRPADPFGTAQLVTWIDSIFAGRVLQPDHGVCEVCDCLHGERDSAGELRNLCRSCLVELLENVLGGDQA